MRKRADERRDISGNQSSNSQTHKIFSMWFNVCQWTSWKYLRDTIMPEKIVSWYFGLVSPRIVSRWFDIKQALCSIAEMKFSNTFDFLQVIQGTKILLTVHINLTTQSIVCRWNELDNNSTYCRDELSKADVLFQVERANTVDAFFISSWRLVNHWISSCFPRGVR